MLVRSNEEDNKIYILIFRLSGVNSKHERVEQRAAVMNSVGTYVDTSVIVLLKYKSVY